MTRRLLRWIEAETCLPCSVALASLCVALAVMAGAVMGVME